MLKMEPEDQELPLKMDESIEDFAPILNKNLNTRGDRNIHALSGFMVAEDKLSRNTNLVEKEMTEEEKQRQHRQQWVKNWSAPASAAMAFGFILVIIAACMSAYLSYVWFHWPWLAAGTALACLIVALCFWLNTGALERAGGCLLAFGFILALGGVIFGSVEIGISSHYCTTHDWSKKTDQIDSIKRNCMYGKNTNFYLKWMVWSGWINDDVKGLHEESCYDLARCCVLSEPPVLKPYSLPGPKTACFHGPVQLANHLQSKGHRAPFQCVDIPKEICIPKDDSNSTMDDYDIVNDQVFVS